MGHYRYFLAIQTRLPEDYLKDAEFRRNLETLRRLGFDGVELNIQDPERVEPARLKAFLAEFGLVLSMFASGLTAKTFQLSLAASDEARRRETIRRTARFLEFAHEFGAGVIAGFLKGAPQENGPGARERLAASVLELAPVADRLKTPLLIEAVNRYESPVGHSLADTWDIARRAGSPFVQILPDTFHMNIEEANMRQAIGDAPGLLQLLPPLGQHPALPRPRGPRFRRDHRDARRTGLPGQAGHRGERADEFRCGRGGGDAAASGRCWLGRSPSPPVSVPAPLSRASDFPSRSARFRRDIRGRTCAR